MTCEPGVLWCHKEKGCLWFSVLALTFTPLFLSFSFISSVKQRHHNDYITLLSLLFISTSCRYKRHKHLWRSDPIAWQVVEADTLSSIEGPTGNGNASGNKWQSAISWNSARAGSKAPGLSERSYHTHILKMQVQSIVFSCITPLELKWTVSGAPLVKKFKTPWSPRSSIINY